ALGNPWIFSQVIALLTGKKDIPFPTFDERKEMVVRHLNALCSFKGERAAVREMRKHICWYIKGYPGAAEARRRFVRAEARTELINLIYQFSQSL
ncbi:MAG: tRNA dihydrouridine synthase DusB, partial [Deltaproteobacteria bacterium]|nr:tRNA dihydrouridine synthase DusB [Deltaproteobacteria bacterium]